MHARLWCLIALVGCGGGGGSSAPAPGAPGSRPSDGVARGSARITKQDVLGTTTLTPALVADTVQRAYLPRITSCYQQYLARVGRAPREGALEVVFVVDAEGRVPMQPEVRTLGPTLAACVQAAVVTWQFPPPTTQAGAPTATSAALTFALEIP